MKSYNLKDDNRSIFWFSKEPVEFINDVDVEFINDVDVKFKDGETCKVTKYLHKENGPAIEHVSGHKQWYINGKRHREDGPAVETHHVNKQWYWYDEYVDVKSQEEFEIWKRFRNFQ